MKFTKENCLGDDYGKAFAMALLEKSGLEIDYKETDFHGFTGVKNKEVKFFIMELSKISLGLHLLFVSKICSIFSQTHYHQLKKNALCLALNMV